MVVLLTAVGLVVAGCGGSDGGSGGGESGKSPIKLGSLSSTSIDPSIALAAESVKAWADWTNKDGGINGHQIELIQADDKLTPATGLAEFQRMRQQGVVAMVGNFVPSSAYLIDAAEQAGIPFVGGMMADDGWVSSKLMFPAASTVKTGTYAIQKLAANAGHPNFVMFECAEAPSCAAAIDVAKAQSESAGATFVNSAIIAAGTSSFAATCIKARDAGGDSILMSLTGGLPTNDKVLQECEAQDWVPLKTTVGIQASGALTNSEYFSKAPGTVGSFEAYPWVAAGESDIPAVKEMFDGLGTQIPGIWDDPDTTEMVVMAWASGELLAAALTNVDKDEVTSRDILDGLWSLPPDFDVNGLTPPLAFNKDKPSNEVGCYFGAKLLDGTWSLVNDGKFDCQT
jgi:branched-chain amino acid transport system substrate-binding protein